MLNLVSCTTDDVKPLPPPDEVSDNGNFLVEHFEYPAGSFLTSHSWTAHSGAETNPIAVAPTGLSWSQTTYIGSGRGLAAAINNTGQDINRPLREYFTTGSVYASFLFKQNTPVTAGGEGFFFHFLKYENSDNPDFSNISTAFRARTHIRQGASATQFKLGLSFNASTPTGSTPDLNISQTYLVVVKYTFVAGDNNDTVSLYVFEDGANITTEPAVATLGPFTGTAADLDIIQGVALRQFEASQDATLDGLYVRTVWNLIDPSVP